MNQDFLKESEFESEKSQSKARPPKLWEAWIPVLALIAMLVVTIVIIDGPVQIPIALAAAVAALVSWRTGRTWKEIEVGITHGISIAVPAILILMTVGVMIGMWVASGVVPMMIFYGLKALNPQWFLAAACLICCVVSLATGSSWTTAGTVGVALIGVGSGLNVPLAMVAGAVVSGSYFGDKLSPLSDSTNLAPAVAGAELFEHIRHMLFTTIPALIVAMVVYLILGFFNGSGDGSADSMNELMATLSGAYKFHWILLAPPVLVITMAALKMPALPSLLCGALLGGVLAMSIQGVGLGELVGIAQDGYVAKTGIESVDELLSRGGLLPMMYTVSLILCALAFGGALESAGMLSALAESALKLAKTTSGVIYVTLGTCIGMNVIAPDQYLSIIMPGRMYRDAYMKRGLHPKNLSRCLEDAGTLSSPLIPWNTCGAYMMTTLGVHPFVYLPFAVLNWVTPMISAFYGWTGWTIDKIQTEKAASEVGGEGE